MATVNMVGFRNATTGAPATRWWSDGNNAIAFAREGRGYTVVNKENTAVTRAFDTGLPAGSYCDLVTGSVVGNHCTGPTVDVDATGTLRTTVPGMSALAIDLAAQVKHPSTATVPSVSFDAYTVVDPGQSLYVVGGTAALGDWDPAHALPMSSATYPIWRATAAIPAGTSFDYKYIKKDASGTVTWESRSNRTASVPGDGWLSSNDAWNAGATVATDVTLNVTPDPGQTVYIVGSVSALGNWAPASAVPLTQTTTGAWHANVTLPGSATVEYKYIRKNTDGSVVWESDPNRSVTTPSGGTVTLNDSWR
jgi:alpha-amylase